MAFSLRSEWISRVAESSSIRSSNKLPVSDTGVTSVRVSPRVSPMICSMIDLIVSLGSGVGVDKIDGSFIKAE